MSFGQSIDLLFPSAFPSDIARLFGRTNTWRLTRTDRTVDIEIYINLSAHVSASFLNTTSTMHTTITSFIAIVGAGRQSKSIHTTQTTHIDLADALTGLPDVFAEDIPVAQSPVQKTLVLEDKAAIGHSSASGPKERRLALLAILKKWKVRAAKKIFKDKIPLVPGADADYMKKLLHHAAYLIAFQEENEKARQELKAPAMAYYTSEEFDATFPPFLQYISRAWAEEISDNVWEELFARK